MYLWKWYTYANLFWEIRPTNKVSQLRGTWIGHSSFGCIGGCSINEESFILLPYVRTYSSGERREEHGQTKRYCRWEMQLVIDEDFLLDILADSQVSVQK